MKDLDFDDLTPLDFRFLLKMKGSVFNAFMDTSFQLDAEKRIKKQMKTDAGKGLIHRATNPGVAHIYCELAIDRFFQDLSQHGYVQMMYGYYDVCRDLIALEAAWSLIGKNTKSFIKLSKEIRSLVDKVDETNDIEEWTDLLTNEGVALLELTASKCRASRDYKHIRASYASALADGVLHDRQLCAFLSHKLLCLAPIDDKNHRTKFVNRVKWPAYVYRIVVARDRGKCSQCHTDITMELLGKPNIDHIFAISKGGCNDVVNLQLLCAQCNLTKGSSTMDVMTSIPSYTQSDYIVFGDMF